jgi:hypothetical protein
MSARIFVSYSSQDGELGGQLVSLLQAMIEGAEVGCSSLPGHEPAGGDDSFAALKQRLADADVVVGLITARALASGEVPFQLGAAWALGKALLLLLGPDGSAAELFLPMGHAEILVLGPEALLELAASLATSTGLRAELGPEARAALLRLFPSWQGFDRESSERPIAAERDSGSTQPLWPIEDATAPAAVQPASAPPASVPTPAAAAAQRGNRPSCSESLQAGRAMSDCIFHRDQGGPFADELDLPFGRFLASLGGNWSMLRDLEDLDVWLEAADNLLEGLPPAEQYVRCWYEVGFQLATLLSLARAELEGESPAGEDLAEIWQTAWATLQRAAHQAGVDSSVVSELHEMFDNLRGPQPERDYANLGRVQQRIRELAGRYDTVSVAVSASAH